MPPGRLGPAGRAQISCPNCRALVHVKVGTGDHLDTKLASEVAPDAPPSRPLPVAPRQAHGAAAPAPVPAAVVPARLRPASVAAAPATAALAWFVAVGRDRRGPMPVEDAAKLVQQGQVGPQSLVWHKGMANWERAIVAQEFVADLARIGVSLAAAAPARAPQPAPQPAQPAPQPAPQPARPTAPKPAAVPAAPPAAQAAAAKPQPAPAKAQAAARPSQQAPAARPAAPKPAALPAASDYDDAGPTLEQAVPLFGKPASGKLERKQSASAAKVDAKPQVPDFHALNADAHAGAFFSVGHDLDNVELQLPDPNKHKPTKEEYQNLLQEFSVMFRLDKRSKRQKVAIAIVAGVLVVGVIVFGVMLKADGDRKRDLIRDSKTILAVFSLPYQTSVTIEVGGDEAAGAQPGQAAGAEALGVAVAIKPKVKTETSALAAALQKKIVAKRKAKATPTKVFAGLSASEQAAIQRQIAAAQAAGLENMKGPGGKVESISTATVAKEKVSRSDLIAMCESASGDLRGCANAILGDANASFKVQFTVGLDGKVGGVKALEDGKANAALTGCAQAKIGHKKFPPPAEAASHTCNVN
jgi:hypothetical protein